VLLQKRGEREDVPHVVATISTFFPTRSLSDWCSEEQLPLTLRQTCDRQCKKKDVRSAALGECTRLTVHVSGQPIPLAGPAG